MLSRAAALLRASSMAAARPPSVHDVGAPPAASSGVAAICDGSIRSANRAGQLVAVERRHLERVGQIAGRERELRHRVRNARRIAGRERGPQLLDREHEAVWRVDRARLARRGRIIEAVGGCEALGIDVFLVDASCHGIGQRGAPCRVPGASRKRRRGAVCHQHDGFRGKCPSRSGTGGG